VLIACQKHVELQRALWRSSEESAESMQASFVRVFSVLHAEFLAFFMQGADKLFVRIEWAKGAAALKLGEALRNTAVDDRFRLENDFALFGPGLKNVSDPDASLLAHVLGNDNLVLVFDGNNGH
jgi:hypothetical protein